MQREIDKRAKKMKVLLLNISDIHVASIDKPENEELVLHKFIIDVEEQIKKFVYDDVFVLISGDLVFAASDESYAKFDKTIVKELMRVLQIDRSHFIIVPGNHDIAQKDVEEVEDSFIPIVEKKYDEDKFNNLVRKEAQKDIFFRKFDAFYRYMKGTMGVNNYSLQANIYNINNIWSVHTLNSAIFSCGAYKNKEDQGYLGVDTRSLHGFLTEDKHPKKILLMHHPEYFCMDWVKHELRKLFGQEYVMVLTGHTHDQDLFFDNKKGYIRCEAPQLFTDKYDDILGYNFILLNGNDVDRIVYRQWQEKRNKFRAGSDFVEEDDSNGIISLGEKVEENDKTPTDKISVLLQERLRREMEAYVGQPYIWVDRYLSDDRLDNAFKMQESALFSELDIIKNEDNIHVVAPSQYGLTCYGSHFLLTLWENMHEFGIKVDADGVRLKKFEKLVESELIHYDKSKQDVKWVVIDNWKPYRKDQKGIKGYLEQEFPNAHLLLMTIYHESDFLEGNSFEEEVIKSKTLYLTPLKRAQERLMVDAYNKEKYIDDSDEILNKLDEDIKNFNLHRSPYSCVTLLTVFKDSFDRNPVNRTDVLENILSIIFDNTRLPNYRTKKPDFKDCDFCMGYFCSELIKRDNHFFKRDFFIEKIRGFCKKMDYDVEVEHLFDILCYNKIIVEDHGLYKFHFTFWVYYFVASWMIANEEYAKDMLEHQKYLHYPEVLEFYTGKDRRRKDAAKTLVQDLSFTSKSVQAKTGIGMKENDDPFAFLRFNQDEQNQDDIINRIESDVQNSNLPQSVKDQAADLSFNPSAAFHQDIFKVYTDFSVGYLVNIIRIGSKVLRNCDQLDSEIKQQLLSELTSAMKVFSNIIYLVSPLFAKQGYIQLTEYRIKLAKEYDDMDEKERTIRILTAIPYNLTKMFKEDIFSSKLSPVFVSALNKEKDKVKRHLIASLLIYKQPEGWSKAITDYMETLGANSYYLGTLLELMLTVFQMGEIDEVEQTRMKNLIKAAVFKSKQGRLPYSQGEYNKIGLTKKYLYGDSGNKNEDNKKG